MMIAERQSRLRQLIALRGMSDLDSLSAELQVSQSTIRRDIEMLEHGGLVERTHGGVIWIGEKRSEARPYAFDQRMNYQLEAKKLIARAARALVQPGQTILIDGGTTTFYLARELLGQSLQLVTNSLPIANLFLNDENVDLVLTGGQVYPKYGVLLGPIAEAALAGIHAQTLFLSAAGIHEGTLYNQNSLLVQAEQRMMQQVQRVVLLADSSKFAQQALSSLCRLEEIDVVVSDSALAPEFRQEIRNANCELILAAELGSTEKANE